MAKHFLKGLVDKDSINEKDGTISVAVATDSSIDRDGDVIETTGIDTGNFERNPVLLYAHDYRSDPIGKVTSIIKEANRMLFQPTFAVNESPRAKMFFDLVKGGFLNAFSIGFIPKEWTDRQNEDGSMTRIFTKSELLEISLVPVPANANALVLARGYTDAEGKALDEQILKDMEEALPEESVAPVEDPPADEEVPAEEFASKQAVEELAAEVRGIKSTIESLSENREKGAQTVDELLGGGDVQRRVLVAVDKAIGSALKALKETAV